MIWWMAQGFASSAVLAAVVALICLWGKRGAIGPVGRHILWAVVLVKLLMPPVIAWPWALFGNAVNPMVAAGSNERQQGTWGRVREWLALEDETSRGQDDVGNSRPVDDPARGNIGAGGGHGDTVSANAPLVLTNPRDGMAAGTAWRMTPARWRQIAALFWAAGGGAFLLLQAVRMVRMQRMLRQASPAEADFSDRLKALSRTTGVRSPRALRVPGIDGPYVWALFRPLLLWPAQMPATGVAEGALMAHELAHIKRRDHWIGWLELLAGCVWWWNPVYWLSTRELRREAELCCDSWVVQTFPEERRGYAEALLTICEGAVRRRWPVMALGMQSGKRELTRRLIMIMQEPPVLRMSVLGWIAVAILAAAAVPAWSAGGGAAPAKLPFTVAKETTVITRPLHADGTPDYIAALNEQFSAGVTPENNGFVLWSELWATNEDYGNSFPPKLREKILQLARAKAPPAGTPTFQNLDKYIFALTGKKYYGAMPWKPVRQVNFQRELWAEPDFPEYALYLKTEEKQLDKAMAAAARPKWWIPVASQDGRALGAAQPPDDMGGAGGVCNALGARALLRLKAGDFDGFLSDVTAIKRLARHMTQAPYLGVIIDRIANDAIAGAVSSGTLTVAQCAALSKTLDALPPLANMDAMEIQFRYEALDAIVLTATGKTELLTEGLDTLFATIDRASVDWDLLLKLENREMDERAAGGKLSLADMRAKNVLMRGKIQELGKAMEADSPGFSFRKPPQHASHEAYSQWLAQIIPLATGMVGIEVEERYRQVKMEDEMLRVLVAAAVAKADTGEWPATVQEMIPGRLKEMPVDIFSADGKEVVRYKVTQKGPRVYSVGTRPKDAGIGDFGLPAEF